MNSAPWDHRPADDVLTQRCETSTGVPISDHDAARAMSADTFAANGRIYLIRPDDSVILPVGERTPTWTDPDPPDEPPDAEALTAMFETISWDEYLATLRADTTGNPDATSNTPPRAWPVLRLDIDDLPEPRLRAEPSAARGAGHFGTGHSGTGQPATSSR